MRLTPEQTDVLLRPLAQSRVHRKDDASHLEVWDVRRWLNRIFGFAGWSEDITDLTMLYEQSKQEGEQTRWRAAYRATVRLTLIPNADVLTTYTEAAVGSNMGWLPDSKRDEAHDMAIKTAASQALKRCAINLGDQFGLSLYQGGSLEPVVGWTIEQRLHLKQQEHTDTDTGEVPEDPPVEPATDDPTVEPTPEPAPQVEVRTDPTVEVDTFTDQLERLRDDPDKRARAAKVARVGIGIKQANVGKHMTRWGVSLDTLLDWATQGKPWVETGNGEAG